MFCPQCGSKVPDGARFCPGCGHGFAAPAAPVAPASSDGGAPHGGKSPGGGRRLRAVLVVCALVVVAALGVGAVMLFRASAAASAARDIAVSNASLGGGAYTTEGGTGYFFSSTNEAINRMGPDGSSAELLGGFDSSAGNYVSSMAAAGGKLFYVEERYEDGDFYTELRCVLTDGTQAHTVFSLSEMAPTGHVIAVGLCVFDDKLYVLVRAYDEDYASSKVHLLAVEVGSEEREELYVFDEEAGLHAFLLTPEKVYFTVYGDSVSDETRGVIYMQNYDGSEFGKAYVSSIGQISGMSFCDGRLVFGETSSSANRTQVTSVTPGGEDAKVLFEGSGEYRSYLVATVDGRAIVRSFETGSTYDDYSFDLLSVPVEGGEATLLLDGYEAVSPIYGIGVGDGSFALTEGGMDVSGLNTSVTLYTLDGTALGSFGV